MSEFTMSPYESRERPLRTAADWWVNERRGIRRRRRPRDVLRWHDDGRWHRFLWAESQTRRLSTAEYERDFLSWWDQYFPEALNRDKVG